MLPADHPITRLPLCDDAVPRFYGQSSIGALTRLRIAAENRQSSVDGISLAALAE